MGSRRDLYVGRAGQRVVMGELLYRGYNVAVPEADVGDDLLVVADGTGRMWRVQVKTSTLRYLKESGAAKGQFWVPLGQLEAAGRPELYYVLAGRWEEAVDSWQSSVVRGAGTRRAGGGRGQGSRGRGRRGVDGWQLSVAGGERRRREDGRWRMAERERGWWEYLVISRRVLLGLRERWGFGTEYQGRMLVTVTFRAESVRGYGVELEGYRNNWGRYWPVREV